MKILLLIRIIIYSLLLQGCTAATIIGTATIGTKIAVDPRTIGRQIDDSSLELRINKAILENEQIRKKAQVSAIVYQGKTLLIGQASSIWLISYIEQIVMKIEGVTKIYNEIRQGPLINFNVILSDIWITTKIRLLLFISNQTKFSNVKVITENSEVFLVGLVKKYEKEILTNIVSHVKGVRNIVTVFDYK